ncbi:hypothetical protein FPV67DRAFT_1466082 [Lyophyllum atratum]|nr:hypothetical protein FPV67DRAFT_1466082 [Lyophyllum atratum]
MEDPSPSQSSENLTKIFHNLDGSQWRVFVEAGGIIGRPKLIRTLKKAGAIVCSDPKQAQVILVDSSSDQGRLFIRDWGNDANKVVLEHSWVKESIAAERVLQDDRWGGHLAVDDGVPIMKEEKDNTLKSPLPTPRITPVEVTTSVRMPSVPPAPMPFNVPPESTQQPFQNGVLYAPGVDVRPRSQPPQLPPHTLPPYIQPSQAMMQSFPPSQHASTTHGLPFPTGPSNIPQQAMLNYMAQCLMQQQNMVPWNVPVGQNFGPPPFFNPQAISQYPQDPHHLPPNAHMNYSPNSSYISAIGSTNSPLSPSGIPPSLRRKSPVISRSTPTSYTSNAGTRSASPVNYSSSMSSQLTTRPTLGPAPTPSSSLFTSKTGQELSFFVQVDLNNRSKVVTAIKVCLMVLQCMYVAHVCQRNGGKISTSNTTADYAILYSRSKTFDHLLMSTLAAKRPAINASFVHDSVEQNKILDLSPYEFEAPNTTARGKRKREKSANHEWDDDAERKRLEKNRRRTERRQQQRKIKEESSPTKKPKVKSKDASWPRSEVTTMASPGPSTVSSDDLSRPRSPTPPAEHTRVRRGTGEGFLYSEHEWDYIRRYVPMLLKRDHRMSMTGIAHSLHSKMDNHTLGAWRTFLGGPSFGAEFEAMRKRASIAYRKAQSQHETSQSEGTGEARHPGISPPLASTLSTVDGDARPRTLVDEDIEFAAQFFAHGGDENSIDDSADRVWARFLEQVKPQTAESWSTFYNDHYEEVSARYNQLVDNLSNLA